MISSALADTPCADLGIDGVLEKLNVTLATSYTLGSRILRVLGIATLHSILKPYVARNDDFGTVYAHLRPYWYAYDVAAIKHELHTREEKDRKMWREVVDHDRITKRNVPPRRVWDLCSNRVVPYWVADNFPCVISHAWVDEKDRVSAMAPVNGYEWPVPMPKDANLDLVRIEMLNLATEYTWLDVVCLRQEGGKNEHLRFEEWKVDVPIIGWVYYGARVVCYFSGLGRPLPLAPDYFSSDRCWFRRAWTLQEITDDTIIGGETADDIMEEEVRKMFDEQLARLRGLQTRDLVLELLLEMQNRVSTKSLDKVAGLAYLLNTKFIPIYNAEKSDEEAWEMLMDAMSSGSRAELLFYFPEPGNTGKCWRPSWQQIMTLKHFVLYLHSCPGNVEQIEATDADWYFEGFCIESADVCGLDEGPKEDKSRQGEMVFKDTAGSPCTFKNFADHVYPIPDGSYALIGSNDEISLSDLILWVAGQLREDGKFEKLSVFRLADDELENLRELGLKKIQIVLC